MRLRPGIANFIHMLKIRCVDLMGCQLVQRPCCGECGKDEAVQSRVNIRRHRLFNDFDAATGIIGEMLGHERLAKGLNPRFLNHPFAGIALETLNGTKFRPWTSFSQFGPLRENLRRRA